MSDNYQYTNLEEDEVRLLWLLPALNPDALLECEVEICKREQSCESYEAMSYVWGTDDGIYKTLKVHPTVSCPFEGKRSILIRPNLEAALQHFRLTHGKRMLWIDAICINQDDDLEKSQQVPLMASIYMSAKQVLVWLGDQTHTTSVAMKFMHDIMNSVDVDSLLKDNAENWAAVHSLLRMPWFARRWIIQEIALARDATVHCGPDQIDWIDFCDAVTFFQQRYLETKSRSLTKEDDSSPNHLGEIQALGACRLVEITQNLVLRSPEGIIQRRLVTLENLVSMLTMYPASRPQDTIYAMVGIAKDIKTVSQLRRSFAPGALPGEAHPILGEHESQKERLTKRQTTTHRPLGELRSQNATRKILDTQVNVPIDVQNGGDWPRNGRIGLEQLLHRAARSQSTQSRDDFCPSFLRVCIDFVAFAITQSESLDIICRPWVPEKHRQECNLPSWLIGTDSCAFQNGIGGAFVRVNADPLVGQNPMHPKRYSACGTRCRAKRLSSANPNDGWGFGFYDGHSDFDCESGAHKSLFVNGFILDRIDEIKEKAEDGTIPSDWFTFGGWHDRSLLPQDPFWRTLVADRELDGSYVQSYYQLTLRRLRNIMRNLPACGTSLNVKAILATLQCDKTSEEVLNRILEVTPNRRLFKTTSSTDNVLGLAPAKARGGDLICILSGCSVPVILRRLQQQIGPRLCDYYELIGDAYVHGLMDGHALDEQIEQDIESQQFEIR